MSFLRQMESQETTATPSLILLPYSAYAVISHIGSLFSLTPSSAPWQHTPFCFVFYFEIAVFFQAEPSSFTKYSFYLRGQMYFYGFNYYLRVGNSEMFLYGMLKCKEPQDSLTSFIRKWKLEVMMSLDYKVTHLTIKLSLVGIRERALEHSSSQFLLSALYYTILCLFLGIMSHMVCASLPSYWTSHFKCPKPDSSAFLNLALMTSFSPMLAHSTGNLKIASDSFLLSSKYNQ